MKVFLDDIRNPPDASWILARTYAAAEQFLFMGNVTEISFDHDLGESDRNGYDLAKLIEFKVWKGEMKVPVWHIHSANPVGRANIEAAMKSAEAIQKQREEQQ